MARSPRRVALEYTARAVADLDAIWEWNTQTYGVSHADRYIAFLRSETLMLTPLSNPGRPVPTREQFRYALIRQRHRGAGHVVVFTQNETALLVLRYFHTAQNWEQEVAS